MSQPTPAQLSAGAKFRAAIAAEKPLQVVGAINAYAARMAEATGFRALYLSGGGVAANSLGLPDLGISTMDDVLIDIRRITEASTLPLLVDADTGWGGAFNIARTVKSFTKAGAAGMHIEDQVQSKRCGHRPGKEVVPAQEMVDRVKAAVDARTDDSLRDHGAQRRAGERRPRARRSSASWPAWKRARTPSSPRPSPTCRCIARCATRCGVPVLANITEFGKTPLYTRDELGGVGVDIVLHCCSAYRAMNLAALEGVPGHSPRRHAEERGRPTCRRATTSTSFSTITPTNRSSIDLFAAEKEKK